MAFEIVWTQVASADLARVLQYLSEEWSQQVADDFTLSLEAQLKIIIHFPSVGIPSARIPFVRRVLISKHNALFYMQDATTIKVIKIVDTRTKDYSDEE